MRDPAQTGAQHAPVRRLTHSVDTALTSPGCAVLERLPEARQQHISSAATIINKKARPTTVIWTLPNLRAHHSAGRPTKGAHSFAFEVKPSDPPADQMANCEGPAAGARRRRRQARPRHPPRPPPAASGSSPPPTHPTFRRRRPGLKGTLSGPLGRRQSSKCQPPAQRRRRPARASRATRPA